MLSGLLACTGVYYLGPGETVPWLLVAVAGTLVTLLLATRIPPLIPRILADPGTLCAELRIEFTATVLQPS